MTSEKYGRSFSNAILHLCTATTLFTAADWLVQREPDRALLCHSPLFVRINKKWGENANACGEHNLMKREPMEVIKVAATTLIDDDGQTLTRIPYLPEI